jgi:hypothetical protein
MYASMTVRKPARPPFAYSTSPDIDERRREKEATIAINPFGRRGVTAQPVMAPDGDLILCSVAR